MLALGAGLLLVNLLPTSFESPVAYVVLLVATGVALLNYDLIEQDEENGEAPGPYTPGEAPATESEL